MYFVRLGRISTTFIYTHCHLPNKILHYSCRKYSINERHLTTKNLRTARKSLEKRNRKNTVPVDTPEPHTSAPQNEEHSTDAQAGEDTEDTVPSLTRNTKGRVTTFSEQRDDRIGSNNVVR